MSDQDYIANCISRILAAECHPSQAYKRDKALADAVRIAARDGEEPARQYLQSVVTGAESGGYARQRANENSLPIT